MHLPNQGFCLRSAEADLGGNGGESPSPRPSPSGRGSLFISRWGLQSLPRAGDNFGCALGRAEVSPGRGSAGGIYRVSPGRGSNSVVTRIVQRSRQVEAVSLPVGLGYGSVSASGNAQPLFSDDQGADLLDDGFADARAAQIVHSSESAVGVAGGNDPACRHLADAGQRFQFPLRRGV